MRRIHALRQQPPPHSPHHRAPPFQPHHRAPPFQPTTERRHPSAAPPPTSFPAAAPPATSFPMARHCARAPRHAGGIPSPLQPLVIRKIFRRRTRRPRPASKSIDWNYGSCQVSCRRERLLRGSGEHGRCWRRCPEPKHPGPATPPATSSIVTRREKKAKHHFSIYLGDITPPEGVKKTMEMQAAHECKKHAQFLESEWLKVWNQGHGFGAYNLNPDVCFGTDKIVSGNIPGAMACEGPQNYVIWNGIHATEAANSVIVSEVMSGSYLYQPLIFPNIS